MRRHQFILHCRGPSLAKTRGMPFREHVQLFGWIRAKVHLRGLERLVSQPQRDLADFAGRIEDVQGAGVPPISCTRLEARRGNSLA